MAKLNLTLPYGELAVTGKQVTFTSPCASDGLTHIILQDTEYILVDSNGRNLVSGAFKAKSIVSVILDVENKRAYIQNADFNNKLKEELDRKANAAFSTYPIYYQESELKVSPQYTASIAEVVNIGGITGKSKNQLPYPYKSNPNKVKTQEISGVTFTDNGDGTLTLNGTSTAKIEYEFVAKDSLYLPAGEYQVSKGNLDAQGYMHIGGADSVLGKDVYGDAKFTFEEGNSIGVCSYQIPKGKTFNKVTIYPQINVGYGNIGFEPYFAGLRSALVTSIETVGKNILCLDGYSADGNRGNSLNGYGTVLSTTDAVNYVTLTQSKYSNPDYPESRENGFMCIHLKEKLEEGQNYAVSFDIKILKNPFNVNSVGVYFNSYHSMTLISAESEAYKVGRVYRVKAYGAYGSISATSTAKYIEIRNYGIDFVLSNIQIEKGETATDYATPRKNQYLIPESVTSLEDYGLGIDLRQYHNEIDYSRKQFVRRVHKIVLDGVTEGRKIMYVNTISTGLVYGQLVLDRRCDITITEDDIGNQVLLCSHFNSGSANIGNCYISGSENHFLIMYHYDQTMQDVDTWNSWLHEQYLAGNPVTCVYILETSEKVDISGAILEDAISVEPEGTVKLVSEYGYDVPSAFIFRASKNDNIESKTFIGNLKGKATFADKATCAVNDDKGNHISSTYAIAPIVSPEDITAGSTKLAAGQSYHVYE